MKIFLDTDILLDVLLLREPFLPSSAHVLDWAATHPGSSAVSWHGIANLQYLSKNSARDFIRELIAFAEVPRVGREQIEQALDLEFGDLEDAMQVVAAMRFGAQFLISRNVRDFKSSPVKAVTPSEAAKLLK